MRIPLALLLLVHGLIHLLGFLKAWDLAPVPQLSGHTTLPLSPALYRAAGALWLVACLLLVSAAALRLGRLGTWWLPAAAGLLLSQALIALQWRDAWAGTFANGALLLAVVLAAAEWRFSRRVEEDLRALYRHQRAPVTVVRAEELTALPPPVRRWLEVSGVVGRERVVSARLAQRGGLRTAPEQGYAEAEAVQHFSVDVPGFLWQVRTRMMAVLPIVGRDRFYQGHGDMLITVAALAPVVHGRGDQIDQGTMLRFLGEIVWFPSAALAPYLRWTAVDERSARATFSQGGQSVTATFHFDERGRFLRLTAERYMGGGDDAKLLPWEIPATEWRVFQGIEVPSKGDALWRLPTGEFSYYRWELTDLAFNEPPPVQ